MGRKVPPLETVTLSNGIPIGVRKLSAVIRWDIAEAVRKELEPEKPQPPLVEVDYGDGPQKIRNEADPTYQRLLSRWEAQVHKEAGDRISDYLIKRGLEAQIDAEEVAQVREDMAVFGVDTSKMDDREVYIRYVAIGPEEDYATLIRAAFATSRPSEEAIRAAGDTFRSHV